MKRLTSVLTILVVVMLVASCAPQVVKETVIVEKPIDKVVKETVVVKETIVVKETVETVITATPEPVTIEWWTVSSEEYSEEAQRAMVKAFEAEHPNITVNMTVLPGSGFSEKMTTALGAGQGGPDVAFFWNNNWFPEALELTPYIEADPDFDPSMYFEGFWKTRAMWGDKIVGLPLGVGANFVMYNKDVFDKAGVAYPTDDWTPDDFIEIATKLTDPATKTWGGDRPRGPFRAIFFNYGARPYSDDGTTVEGYLNSPETIASYTWLWDLVNSGSTPTPADLKVLSAEGSGPVDLFLAGRLGMATLNQGHMLNAVNAGANFGIVPEPSLPGETQYMHGWALTCSIWKGSEHPQEAWEFLSYWVGAEGQKFLMENGNLFPSIPTVLEEYKDADKEYAQAFFKVLALDHDAEWLGAHPCYRGGVERAISDLWDKIMLGEIERDQIKAEMESLMPVAQEGLDECLPRLGG